MSKIQHIGHAETCERELFSLSSPDFASVPESIPLPTRHFVALLAADAAGVHAGALAEFSRRLLRAGCVCFCAWGPDCERVHDVFDSECFDIEPVIMTTWHAKDSLDEALWFFVSYAYPDDGYRDTSGAALAISIGKPGWDEQIRRRLADLESLRRDVVDKT
jgi:hypothetical protein